MGGSSQQMYTLKICLNTLASAKLWESEAHCPWEQGARGKSTDQAYPNHAMQSEATADANSKLQQASKAASDDNGEFLCRKAEFLPRLVQNCLVRWCLRSGASECRIRATIAVDLPIGCEVLIVMHSVVKATARVTTSHDDVVPIK